MLHNRHNIRKPKVSDEYKRYMWVKVTLCEVKLYVACCCIPHSESNYYNLYELDLDYPFLYVCVDILPYEKIGKLLVMGDFKVGTYQNVEGVRFYT